MGAVSWGSRQLKRLPLVMPIVSLSAALQDILMYTLEIKLFRWILNLRLPHACTILRLLEHKDVPHSMAQEPTTSSEPTSRLFALLIGIDKYKSSPLSGAAKDVSDVESYLHEILRTPYLQITTLKNEAATCQGIRSALDYLAVDGRIKKDDAILICFAGHGSTAVAPEEWKKFCQNVELIVPCDADLGAGTNMIADRQLAYHLNKIVEAKGNNITVILDCCHSGSGTRYPNGNGTNIRSVKTTTSHVLNESDHNIRAGDKSQPQGLSRFLGNTAETSHVLLAACKPDQKAREKDGQGVFTQALLKTLRKQQDISQLTYEDLVRQIGCINTQNPQCEGMNKGCFVFSGKVPHVTRYLHNVIYSNSEKYVIRSGIARGITRGAKYRLYENREAFVECKSLGIMIADHDERKSGDIILEPISGQPIRTPTDTSRLLALQVFAGKDEYLPVYAATNDAIYPQLQFFEQQVNQPWQIQLVESRKAASIGLSLSEEGEMSIEILDKHLHSFGMKHLTHKIKVNPLVKSDHNLAIFLEAVVSFMKHQKQERSCPQIQNGIEIEFFELVLQRPNGSDLMTAWGEPKKDEGGTVQNLIHDGKIELNIPEKCESPGKEIITTERYGLTIRNNSVWPLYVSVLFFSVSKFEITSYYEPPFLADNRTNSDDLPQACISPGKELAVGHGPSGWPSWVLA